MTTVYFERFSDFPYIKNSNPVRVVNNLQGEGKGDSVIECRGEEKEEEEKRERERKSKKKKGPPPPPQHPLKVKSLIFNNLFE